MITRYMTKTMAIEILGPAGCGKTTLLKKIKKALKSEYKFEKTGMPHMWKVETILKPFPGGSNVQENEAQPQEG